MSSVADRIAQLSPEQRDALMLRLGRKGPVSPPPLVDEASDAPLSFAQETMYFHNELVANDSAHNISGALRMCGTLSCAALQSAFDAVVARHETLRSSFSSASGELRQQIHIPSPQPIAQIDLTHLDPASRTSESQQLARAEALKGFNLGTDRLLRTTLIRLDPHEHLLLLTMHHIISDGWSAGVLLKELGLNYQAACSGSPSPLPPLPIQYRHFAAAQRTELATSTKTRIAFWKQNLQDAPDPVRLRPDALPYNTLPDHEGIAQRLLLDPALVDALEALSRTENTTLFTILLTAFLIVVSRLTAQEDLVVGSPVSGRNRIQTEDLIGLFVNTVALRASIRPGTVRESIATVSQTVLNALANDLTPTSVRSLEWPGLHVTFEEPPVQGAEFSLQMFVTRIDKTIELKLLYPIQSYSKPMIQAVLEQMQATLGQMVRDPLQPIAAINLATARDCASIPAMAAKLDATPPMNVPREIARWITQTPDRTAISAAGQTLTYAAFGSAIESAASQLRAAGLVPGDRVAVFGPRGVDVVICMNAVLFAGGVLINLSSDLPEHRRQTMLEEANARFLLSCQSLPRDCTWTSNAAVLHYEQPTHHAAPVSIQLPHNDEAYIFFTSGSTGKPKGILGTHAGLGHFLHWQRETFGVTADDRCAHLTGLSFDVVLRDVFLTLVSGGTLVIPSEQDTSTAEATLLWLKRERITILHTVPSIIDLWLMHPPEESSFPTLRLVFVAGEPLTADLVARWRRVFSASQIINLYGPTETTLAKCFYRVPEALLAGIQPLGEPLPQTQIMVLNPQHRLCATGEPGELAIRTPFRTRGYLAQTVDSKTRFISNPLTQKPDDLVYLTGDLGMHRADGLFQFLGRADHQLKIRGVRVEPGEVAAVLKTAPGVATAAIVPHEPPSGTTLAAYIVLDGNHPADASTLRDFLRLRLPAAMIPSSFTFLDELPLTANHKLDRQRLPKPEEADSNPSETYDPPRDPFELQLTALWEELLDVRPISVTRSFFDLGGHSLLAMRLLMRMEHTLHRRLPMAAFLAQPTIRSLAAASQTQDDPASLLIKLWHPPTGKYDPETPSLFLIHSGGGALFNCIDLVRHLAAPVTVYGIQAKGLDDTEPHTSIPEMASAYVALIRETQPNGPYFVAGHSLGAIIAFEIAQQLSAQGHALGLVALFDPPPPGPGPTREETSDEEDARLLTGLLEALNKLSGQNANAPSSTLSTEQRLDEAAAALRTGTSAPDAKAMVRNMLRIVKAHTRARYAYRPQPASFPLRIFQAAQETGTGSLAWADLAQPRCNPIVVPGDHVSMMAEPHVPQLARHLRFVLHQALETSRPVSTV